MPNQRKNDTARKKAFIFKRHLVDRVPVSDLCDEYTALTSKDKWEGQDKRIFKSARKKYFSKILKKLTVFHLALMLPVLS